MHYWVVPLFAMCFLYLLFLLFSQRRLLLRDTPLPHTWKDLWTMVHFLIPGLSRPYMDFPVKDGSDQDQEYRHTISIRLHRVINKNSGDR